LICCTTSPKSGSEILKYSILVKPKQYLTSLAFRLPLKDSVTLVAVLVLLLLQKHMHVPKFAYWEAELSRLCDFAISQPQAAYATFTHGLVHKWTFLSRTIADIGHLFQPLEDIIRHRFIPALTGRQGINDDERTLFALPVRPGGLNIPNPTLQAKHHHQASQKITQPVHQP
jgi:hypothetical protein